MTTTRGASARRYTKADVTMRRVWGMGGDCPAVNIKVYKGPSSVTPAEWAQLQTEHGTGFTAQWCEEHVGDDGMDSWFWDACEFEFEYVQGFADEVLHEHVTVERDGRSGGWAVVSGLPELEDWDAVALARWRKFERWCREIADGLWYQVYSLIGMNVFDTAAERYAAALEGESVTL